MPKHEAAYLDEAEARELLMLLHKEPIKYRAMITFDLLSGLRVASCSAFAGEMWTLKTRRSRS